jgi:hypothetical protein
MTETDETLRENADSLEIANWNARVALVADIGTLDDYKNTLRREDDGWRIARRQITIG